ncbi:hypothetical protein COCMIDRAFT_103533 [Bipolaris oryzae ATCC 44560]|uniref:Uncharacterized protein n=1 Tax=Bipolaris oryzae ATCC 44560 TaxID=930090 RepID=W6YSH6_COCMI|nr:uncharacterized protein COCMIDRAFT_103533 [Bipolaris oryzae ATCC 44560]EUC42402.1 hypothetical protein COCMIDRAFT_103533 [Bipolaris oryzae ATCC 44560]
MQYRLVSILAAGVLVSITSAAPVPSADNLSTPVTNPPNTIELGKPSSEIIWSKSKKSRSPTDDTLPTNPDDIVLTPPNYEIIWSKEKARDLEFEKPKDSFNLGKPSTVVTWGKREELGTPEDTIGLGKPSTVVTWGKRDVTTPEDTIGLGKPSTEVTWS